MIRLRGVSYAYPDTANYVLADLDLSVGQGEVVGVVGASGAGKTTLAKIIAGFIPSIEGGVLSGDIDVNGVAISSLTLSEAVAQVGLVIQNPFNQISGAKFTVLEEIAFGLENTGVPREEIAERVQAVAKQLRVDHLLDRSPYALSGGQMQLVAIASMVVMRTPVLVMDEPTSQLDPGGSRMVFDIISQLTDLGTTVLIFEHKIELLREHADRVAVLADGRITAEGAPRAILSDPRLEKWAIGTTRYTRAGLAARDTGLAPVTGELPVSMPDAVEFFGPSGKH
ncbi:MAG: Cobalt transporter ATP-binding protein [Rhodoglobus sp.]|nr:Cobalt transporter ATP-binding protein [Rhodoglobus sp.]